ncbi:hypothetical protein FGG08_002835 [Glutinoglossum americanum]|uniref:Conidiophore development protein hymA n=1 Tax=Glutinoglossum americanum TaxID=1670608 RepID=A0A9P8I5I4_9PEZI|nr:hypothetical protein FGG08_002835 [Glutinoglossum americanum]
MSFLFGRNKQKSSAELSKLVKESILRLDSAGSQKAEEDLARLLAQIKHILQGTAETESSPEQVYQLITSLIQEDLLLLLAVAIPKLPFETRKDAQVIFSYVFRYKPPNSPMATEPLALNHVINSRPEVIVALCKGYEHRESAMSCGTVLREVLKHDAVAAIILYDEPKSGSLTNVANGANAGKGIAAIQYETPQTGQGIFWRFFDWVEAGGFEISTDAFSTFRDILTKHKPLVSSYLSKNFTLFFGRYNSLVLSNNYVTKRQSIKLLGEILLDRANYQVMTAYVDSADHLKICMNLLRDERKMVAYEGFHVFKVFVANPNKSMAVQQILIKNRNKLLKFLPEFLGDRTDDEQFSDEKAFLIRQIETMPSSPIPPHAPQPATSGGPVSAGTVT